MAVIERSTQDIIEQNMMEYGAYIILQRAIPDLRDGLKPVHRRILYTMDLEKATKLTKSANIEGQVMKLHPHGSSYGTMVSMVQKDRTANPLIIGKGNFSQATSRELQPAASRYTEVKLSEMSIEMLGRNLKKNLVDFIPNYDGTIMMPEVLPVKFPVILTQPSSGMALGMASSIPSFNLVELVNAMVKYIKEDKMTLLVPDFATGGYIINNKEIFKDINLKGSGSVQIRGKAEIDGYKINITEIPFSTTREAIIDKIVELNKSGKLSQVSNVKDLTGLQGMLVEVTFKRGTDMNTAKELLYQLTPLQSSYSTNLNVIVNKGPKVLSVWQVIKEWIKWRKETIVRGIKFDISSMSEELHFLRGLEKVLLDIDKVIEIIRKSSADLIEPNLMSEFGIDEIQAKEIADMKLRNINKDYIENDLRQNDLVIKGLEEVRDKYGRERMSKIIEVNTEKVKAIKKELQAVPNFPIKLFITKEGYIRKMQPHADNDPEKHKLKPGDEIKQIFETMNNAELLVFGKDKACYKIKVSDIEEVTPSQMGVFIPSLCEVKEIVGVSVLDGKNKFVIIVYDNNKVAKIKLSSFEGNRKKLSNSLAANLNVIGILTYADDGYFIFRTTTNIFKVPTSKYELKERWTQGVYGPQKGVVKSVEMA
jgi:DNA gyrase subunit A